MVIEGKVHRPPRMKIMANSKLGPIGDNFEELSTINGEGFHDLSLTHQRRFLRISDTPHSIHRDIGKESESSEESCDAVQICRRVWGRPRDHHLGSVHRRDGRTVSDSDLAANLEYVTVRVLDVGVRGSVAAVLADV